MYEVEFKLNEERVSLKPSLRALKAVNSSLGSLGRAYAQVAQLDFNAMLLVIAAGTNKTPKDFEQAVYDNGLGSLVAPLTDFINRLENRGRPIEPTEESEPTGEA